MNRNETIKVLKENEFKLYDENNNKIYVSDVLTDKISSWENKGVIIDGAMARGKTSFIVKEIYEYLKEHGKKSLLLANRHSLKNKQKYDLKLRYGEDYEEVMEVNSYQNIQKYIKQGKWVDNYDFIICDEAHYVTADIFNNNTIFIFNMLLQRIKDGKTTILMSATANSVWNLFINTANVIDIKNYYKFYADYSHIKSIHVFDKFTDILEVEKMIEEDIDLIDEERRKAIIFCETVEEEMRLKEHFETKYNIKVATVFSERNDRISKDKQQLLKQYLEESKKLIDEQNNTFNCSILLCTKAWDNGIEFKDKLISIVSIRLFDLVSAGQCFGRVRNVYEENAGIDVYLKNWSNTKVKRALNEAQKKLDIIEEIKEEHDKIYEYESKKDIIYRIKNNTYINEIACYKYQYDVDIYTEILNQNNIGEIVITRQEKLSVSDFIWNLCMDNNYKYYNILEQEAQDIRASLNYIEASDEAIEVEINKKINTAFAKRIFTDEEKMGLIPVVEEQTAVKVNDLEEVQKRKELREIEIIDTAKAIFRYKIFKKILETLDSNINICLPGFPNETNIIEDVRSNILGIGYIKELFNVLELYESNFDISNIIFHTDDKIQLCRNELYKFCEENNSTDNKDLKVFAVRELIAKLNNIITANKEMYNYFTDRLISEQYSKKNDVCRRRGILKKKLEKAETKELNNIIDIERSHKYKEKLKAEISELDEQVTAIDKEINNIKRRSNLPHTKDEYNEFFRTLEETTNFPYELTEIQFQNRKQLVIVNKNSKSRITAKGYVGQIWDLIQEWNSNVGIRYYIDLEEDKQDIISDRMIIKNLKDVDEAKYYSILYPMKLVSGKEVLKRNKQEQELFDYLETIKISGEIGVNATYRKVQDIEEFKENRLEKYLEENVGKKLFKEEREQFINICNFKDDRNRQIVNISIISENLKGYGYKVESKRVKVKGNNNKTTAWIISKI